MPYQTAKDMIDTTSLTALISAFRAEVTQNSISPEKVGGILQQIADLLATATPDSDMSEFTVLRQRLMSISTMFTSLAQGTSDRNHIYLTSNTYNVATGTKYTDTDSIRIQQATTERAVASLFSATWFAFGLHLVCNLVCIFCLFQSFCVFQRSRCLLNNLLYYLTNKHLITTDLPTLIYTKRGKLLTFPYRF